MAQEAIVSRNETLLNILLNEKRANGNGNKQDRQVSRVVKSRSHQELMEAEAQTSAPMHASCPEDLKDIRKGEKETTTSGDKNLLT